MIIFIVILVIAIYIYIKLNYRTGQFVITIINEYGMIVTSKLELLPLTLHTLLLLLAEGEASHHLSANPKIKF